MGILGLIVAYVYAVATVGGMEWKFICARTNSSVYTVMTVGRTRWEVIRVSNCGSVAGSLAVSPERVCVFSYSGVVWGTP